MEPIALKDVGTLVGQEVGVSDWLQITQERVNQFAGWITAITSSPISSCGPPTTATSATFGWVMSRFSISCG